MSLFRDLNSAKSIYAKGILFVLMAMLAGGLLLAKVPRWDIAMLLVICIWASCRAYYFAFYVIEKYVDSKYRFSGLFDFAMYLLLSLIHI